MCPVDVARISSGEVENSDVANKVTKGIFKTGTKPGRHLLYELKLPSYS